MQIVIKQARMVLENMQKGELNIQICQIGWTLRCMVRTIWLLIQSSPVLKAVSSLVSAALPLLTTILSVAVLLYAGLHPAQIILYAAWERLESHNSLVVNGDFGRGQEVPEFTRIMQGRFCLDKAL